MLDLGAALSAQVEAATEHATLHVDMAAQHEVLQDGHVLEELDVLECAGDAQGRDAVRGEAVEGVAGPVSGREGDRPRLGPVQSRDAVQDAGLPRAVRADECQQLAPPHLHGEVRERGDPAEPEGQVAEIEDGGGAGGPVASAGVVAMQGLAWVLVKGVEDRISTAAVVDSPLRWS